MDCLLKEIICDQDIQLPLDSALGASVDPEQEYCTVSAMRERKNSTERCVH